MSVVGSCFRCGEMFTFSPTKVPSHRDADGVRQPFCRPCVEEANPIRVKNGLEPIVIHPDAYVGDEHA